jgi:hypothetical protein
LECLPARPSRLVELPGDLPEVLVDRLRTRGITRLWSHQAAAIARPSPPPRGGDDGYRLLVTTFKRLTGLTIDYYALASSTA